jgi:hypothetical protein
VGQDGIAGYPASYMIMADIHFEDDGGTISAEEAFYNANNVGQTCAGCHNVDPMHAAPERTVTYIEPGGPEHTVEVLVLPPIGLTDDDFGSDGPPNAHNNAANLRNPTTLFESACVGSARSSDYCNRLGAVLGHTPVDCAAPVTCDGDDECDPGEHNSDCPEDCPKVCGNSLCEDHETAQSCAYDCST